MLLNCGVGEDSWESLGLQGDQISQSKGIQPWIFIGRIGAEAPKLWPPDSKTWLIGKDPDAEKDWGQEEKWATEDEMVGRHYWLTGHEFEQTLGDREGQGSLACCSLWGHKELDMTYWLNNMSCQTKSLKAPCILHSLIAPPVGSSPGSGRSPREGNGTPLQYSCLENFMDRSLTSYSPQGSKEVDTT